MVRDPRALLVAVSCSALCSCVAFSTIEAYPGPKRTPDQVAAIKTPQICTTQGCGLLSEVDGVVYGSPLKGYPNAVNLLPGKHTVKIRCEFGNVYANPEFEMTFEAGKTYGLRCEADGRYKVSGFAEETKK